jgi:hypothetical protein
MEELGRGTIGGGRGFEALADLGVDEFWRLDMMGVADVVVVSRVSLDRLLAGWDGCCDLCDDVENGCGVRGVVARLNETALTLLCRCLQVKPETLI